MGQTKFEAENNIEARRLYIHRGSMLRHHSRQHSIADQIRLGQIFLGTGFQSRFIFNFVTHFERGFRGFDKGKVNFSLHKQKMIAHHNNNHEYCDNLSFLRWDSNSLKPHYIFVTLVKRK